MIVDDEAIRINLGLYRDPIGELEELRTDYLLGRIKISKIHRGYSVGFGGALTPASHFRKQWFDVPAESRRGWAVVFHAFDREELIAGWVPPEREADAERWIAFLNGAIARRLVGPEGGP